MQRAASKLSMPALAAAFATMVQGWEEARDKARLREARRREAEQEGGKAELQAELARVREYYERQLKASEQERRAQRVTGVGW